MSSHQFVDGTELGLPEGMCVRCATSQDSVQSKCETEQLPQLTWKRIDSDVSELSADGTLVAFAYRNNIGLFSWRTKPSDLLLQQSKRIGCFSRFKDAKDDCEQFVLANLATKPKATP